MSPEEINFLTPLLCIGSPVALGVFAFALHKSHEIRASWDRPVEIKSARAKLPEGQMFLQYFHTGNPNELIGAPRQNHDLYLHWRNDLQSNRARQNLFLEYLVDRPHADMGEIWAYINHETAPVSRHEHKRSMREVRERINSTEQTANEAQNLARKADRKANTNRTA